MPQIFRLIRRRRRERKLHLRCVSGRDTPDAAGAWADPVLKGLRPHRRRRARASGRSASSGEA